MATKINNRVIAIEVRGGNLHLAIVEGSPTEAAVVRQRAIPWRYDAVSLASEQGIREMSVALGKLAAAEKLSGAKVHFVLSGEYCVTRVVTGSAEIVRRELDRLQERVPLYLGLGLGKKIVVENITQLDARHQHGLLTVANQQTLLSLLQAADTARIEVGYVESSLVALSRAQGRSASDQTPRIVVNLGEDRCELGIALGERLLLDYRPAGRNGKDIAALIAGHLPRLQKFFDRHYRLNYAKLGQVLLCGESETIAATLPLFKKFSQLSVSVLEPSQINPQWNRRATDGEAADQSAPASEGCAALGTSLAASTSLAQRHSTNLIAPLLAARKIPLRPLILKTLWPAAAALFIAASIFGYAQVEDWSATGLRTQIAALEPQKSEVERLRATAKNAESKQRLLHKLQASISQRGRAELVETITHCMPEFVWLERLEIKGSGGTALHGTGIKEDDVYSFLDHLKEAPGLKEVQLESTSGSGGGQVSGRATKFDVKFISENFADSVKTEESNDG
jgi:Tfp pilus assembly protein PilN